MRRAARLLSAATPLMLGGLLALPAARLDHVPWAGCRVFPVGDSLALGAPAADGAPPYQVTRNVANGHGARAHGGADLSNRSAGGLVRAAAHGLVVHAGPGRPGNGFGWHVVLAHREFDGTITYTVYAHLAAGSVAVTAGRIVMLGAPLGRVGRTGRASAPHLHFEVRRPRRLEERWERAPVSDPVAWVEARRPVAREDSAWALPALAWAEGLGGLDAETAGDEPLTRGQWWRLLSAARPGPLSPLTRAPDLRRALIEAGALAADGPRRAAEAPGPDEIGADLGRLETLGGLAPVAGADTLAHGAALLARVPWWRPQAARARERDLLRSAPPTVADAALLLMDVALAHQRAAGPAPPLAELLPDTLAAR